MAENIGFIGLGVMGKPMAKHLIAADAQCAGDAEFVQIGAFQLPAAVMVM